MKYIFRGITVFEYIPDTKQVIEYKITATISAFTYCKFIPEDYKLLSEFFNTVYLHINGEEVQLEDIIVN
jgi:hypothetical protein